MYYIEKDVVQDYVRAHMWWSIAVLSGNKNAIKYRDIVAKDITPSQLEKYKTLPASARRKTTRGAERVEILDISLKSHFSSTSSFMEDGQLVSHHPTNLMKV